MTEEVLGILGATLTGKRTWFSGLSNVQCQLIFTNERIVVARLGSYISDPMGKATYWVVTDPQELKGFFPEQILSSDERNFSIPYSEITKVKIGRKWMNPRVHVHTSTEIYRFMWTWPVNFESVDRIIRQLMPSNLSIQKSKKLE